MLDLRGFRARVSPASPEGLLDLRVLGSHVARTNEITRTRFTRLPRTRIARTPEGVLDLRLLGAPVVRTSDRP